MDIEKQSKRNNKRSRPQQEKQQKAVSKDLLRLQRPIFQLKRSQQNQSEFVIRKLMAKKQKPQIGMVGRSPLLSRLEQLMPVFKKSNQDLNHRVIEQSEKIDAKLQQCQQSDSQSDSQDEDETEKKQQNLKVQEIGMQVQKTNHAQSDEMKNESEQQSLGQFLQINFLTYPYLNQEQLAKLQVEKMGQKRQQQQKQKQKAKSKKPLIEQIAAQTK